jgi:hypothetical protein
MALTPDQLAAKYSQASTEYDVDLLLGRLESKTKKRYRQGVRRELLCALICGDTLQSIANDIGRTYKTVRKYASEIYQDIRELTGEESAKATNLIYVLEKHNYKKGQSSIQRLEQSVSIPNSQSALSAPAPNFVGRESAIANTRHDLSEAPDVSVFYGRTEELTTLEQWIVTDRCRLVALWGMGGIGKTALAVKLVERVKDEFEYVIWRSLQYEQPVQDILADLIEFFCDEQQTALLNTSASGISRLIRCLQARRCLVVLDGVEMILGTGQLAGTYREGYQEYGKLFGQVGELTHQSCLVLTSSEKFREIRLLESKKGLVRSQKLKGLQDAAREILRDRGLVEEDEWSSLIEHYRGNPLSLRIVSATILDLFNGKASAFLRKNTTFVGEIHEVLDQVFERLSLLEIEVMCQLAINQEPVTIDQLREGISSPVSTSKLMEALESLGWRSLIEQIIPEWGEVLYTLQPVVRKYVINHFCQT